MQADTSNHNPRDTHSQRLHWDPDSPTHLSVCPQVHKRLLTHARAQPQAHRYPRVHTQTPKHVHVQSRTHRLTTPTLARAHVYPEALHKDSPCGFACEAGVAHVQSRGHLEGRASPTGRWATSTGEEARTLPLTLHFPSASPLLHPWAAPVFPSTAPLGLSPLLHLLETPLLPWSIRSQ